MLNKIMTQTSSLLVHLYPVKFYPKWILTSFHQTISVITSTQLNAKHGLNVIFIEKNGVMYFEK